MTFLLILSAAILGIFTGKFIYQMNQQKTIAVKPQANADNNRVYKGIKK